MEELGKYILSIVSAAVIVSICSSVTGERSALSGFIRITGGLFMAIVILTPISDWDWDGEFPTLEMFEQEAEFALSNGTDLAREAESEIISAETCAYILDKAESMGADISVEVILNGGDLPVPDTVYLSGKIAPYARNRIESMIETDIGIPKERQIWLEQIG